MQDKLDEIMQLKNTIQRFEGENTNYKAEINTLLDDNKTLNTSYEDMKTKFEFYKNKYIEEVKNGNKLQDVKKSLFLEISKYNTIIAELEKKLNETEKKLINYTEVNYSNKGILIAMFNNGLLTNNGINKNKIEKEYENCMELTKQLKAMEESKTLTQSNLDECRNNILKLSLELKDTQEKLIALEKMRLSDVLHISRLENLLISNKIRY